MPYYFYSHLRKVLNWVVTTWVVHLRIRDSRISWNFSTGFRVELHVAHDFTEEWCSSNEKKFVAGSIALKEYVHRLVTDLRKSVYWLLARTLSHNMSLPRPWIEKAFRAKRSDNLDFIPELKGKTKLGRLNECLGGICRPDVKLQLVDNQISLFLVADLVIINSWNSSCQTHVLWSCINSQKNGSSPLGTDGDIVKSWLP